MSMRTGFGRPVGVPPSNRLGVHFLYGFLSVFHDLAGSLTRWAARGRERRLRERTMRDLSALNDAALKDIGMSRSEIASIASHPADRRGRTGFY